MKLYSDCPFCGAQPEISDSEMINCGCGASAPKTVWNNRHNINALNEGDLASIDKSTLNFIGVGLSMGLAGDEVIALFEENKRNEKVA